MADKTAVLIFRDYITDGNPGSGAQDPVKADIRAWGTRVDSVLGVAGLAATRRQLIAALADATNPAGRNVYPDVDSAMSALADSDASIQWISGSVMVIGDPLATFIKATLSFTDPNMATLLALALTKPL